MSVTTTFISNTPTPARNTDVGINVSKPGFNALSTSGSNLVYSSSWPTLQYPFEANVTGETMPNSPYKFSVLLNSAQNSVNGTTVVNYDNVLFDSGNNFNATTHTFTTPVSGYYSFDWQIAASSTAPTLWTSFVVKNGSTVGWGDLYATQTFVRSNGSRLLQLAIGDTIQIWLQANGVNAISPNNQTYFEGYLFSV